MPKFTYIASNPKGESSRGELDALNKSDLAKKLKGKGSFLVSCRSDEAATAPTVAPPSPSFARATSSSAPSSMPAPHASFQDRLDRLLHPGRKVDPNIPPKGNVPLKELVVLTR